MCFLEVWQYNLLFNFSNYLYPICDGYICSYWIYYKEPQLAFEDMRHDDGGALHSCNITNWPLIWSHIAMCTCLGFWFWMTLQVWLDSLYFPRPNWMTGDRCRGWQIYLPTFTLSAEKAKCRCKPIVDFVKSQLLLGGFTNCLKRRQSPVNRWTP